MTIAAGSDTDHNGLPDAWEIQYFGHTGVDANADPDGDGLSNLQEYRAGTNPRDPSSTLAITALRLNPDGASASLTWQSAPTRCYYIEQRLDLSAGSAWSDSGLGLIVPDGLTTTRTFTQTNASTGFYRVQTIRPLAP